MRAVDLSSVAREPGQAFGSLGRWLPPRLRYHPLAEPRQSFSRSLRECDRPLGPKWLQTPRVYTLYDILTGPAASNLFNLITHELAEPPLEIRTPPHGEGSALDMFCILSRCYLNSLGLIGVHRLTQKFSCARSSGGLRLSRIAAQARVTLSRVSIAEILDEGLALHEVVADDGDVAKARGERHCCCRMCIPISLRSTRGRGRGCSGPQSTLTHFASVGQPATPPHYLVPR